jgi:mitogen-activated protein kinase kinase kinase 13
LESDVRPSTDVIDALRNENADVGEEESWSDEEGEDPNYTYNYSLRRRR